MTEPRPLRAFIVPLLEIREVAVIVEAEDQIDAMNKAKHREEWIDTIEGDVVEHELAYEALHCDADHGGVRQCED